MARRLTQDEVISQFRSSTSSEIITEGERLLGQVPEYRYPK